MYRVNNIAASTDYQGLRVCWGRRWVSG